RVHSPSPTPSLFPYTTLFRSRQSRLFQEALEASRASQAKLAQQGGGATAMKGGKEEAQGAMEALKALEKAKDNKSPLEAGAMSQDRKSTRLNSSHLVISYAVF